MSEMAKWQCDNCESENQVKLSQVAENQDNFKSCNGCGSVHLLQVEGASVQSLTQMARD